LIFGSILFEAFRPSGSGVKTPASTERKVYIFSMCTSHGVPVQFSKSGLVKIIAVSSDFYILAYLMGLVKQVLTLI
jgi:hypothetical protein